MINDLRVKKDGKTLSLLFLKCFWFTFKGPVNLLNTISIISREIPLKQTKVRSGSNVFDWTVPDEWNVTSAIIYDSNGKSIVDFLDNNLFLMSYSVSISELQRYEELHDSYQ